MKHQYVSIRIAAILIATFLIIYGLIVAKNFLYPLAFGIMFSYLLYPGVNFLEKKGFPRILAILILIVLIAALFGFSVTFIMKRSDLFLQELPGLRIKTIQQLNTLQLFLQDHLGISSDRVKNFLQEQIFNVSAKSVEFFSATTHTVFAILMQPVFVFLFLFYRTKFAYFILKMVGRSNRIIAVDVLREIATITPKYLLGVATVVLILCVINAVGYWIIGLKYFLLLGIIASLFSFIPYFGTIMGGLVTLTYVLLTEDSGTYALRVLIFVYVVNFIENNILTPNIVGHNVRINPFVIILSLMAAAMIWGLPGMIVVIPFLAMFYVVIKKIPGMQSYVYLLGTRGTKKHALSKDNLKKFVKRLRPFKTDYKNE